jgi:hypothetical protein
MRVVAALLVACLAASALAQDAAKAAAPAKPAPPAAPAATPKADPAVAPKAVAPATPAAKPSAPVAAGEPSCVRAPGRQGRDCVANLLSHVRRTLTWTDAHTDNARTNAWPMQLPPLARHNSF